jgi:drug/metabolite transporter (DMT)-like permease
LDASDRLEFQCSLYGAGLLLIAASPATEGAGAFLAPTLWDLLAILYLAVFVTALAFVFWVFRGPAAFG